MKPPSQRYSANNDKSTIDDLRLLQTTTNSNTSSDLFYPNYDM